MRNFGCAHPEGYRKALRLMRLGEKFGLPVISLDRYPRRLSRASARKNAISLKRSRSIFGK